MIAVYVLRAYDDRRGEYKAKSSDALLGVDEGRKRVLLIAASILAARKLAQYEQGKLSLSR